VLSDCAHKLNILIGIFQRFWELTVRIYKRISEMHCSIGLALNDKLFMDPSMSFTEHHTTGPNSFWLNPLVNTLKTIHFGMCPMFVTTANRKPKRIQKRTEQQTVRRSFQWYAKRTFTAHSKQYTSQVCCHYNRNYSDWHEQAFYKHDDNCDQPEMSITKTSFEQVMHDQDTENQFPVHHT
jgi:hypothetical protein